MNRLDIPDFPTADRVHNVAYYCEADDRAGGWWGRVVCKRDGWVFALTPVGIRCYALASPGRFVDCTDPDFAGVEAEWQRSMQKLGDSEMHRRAQRAEARCLGLEAQLARRDEEWKELCARLSSQTTAWQLCVLWIRKVRPDSLSVGEKDVFKIAAALEQLVRSLASIEGADQ